MITKLLDAQDIASATFALIMIAQLATGVLLLAGTAWVARRWKLVVALGGIASLAAAGHYLIATDVWLATGKMTMIHRYVGWFITMPVQVVMLYFYVRAYAHVPVGVFWRILVAAILMVTARFMGEANLMLPTLGFLLSLALWLYILGEAFFGWMGERNLRHGSEAAQRGFFWLRLIMTIGWAIYPLTYFIASFTGTVPMRYLVTTYNLSDFVNVIAFSLTILAAGMCEAEASRA
jgi:sensory rhodopsin